jgi:nicotinate-nucleotide pyrophosphorylase (carboxylating)
MDLALQEDLGLGDITTELINVDHDLEARLVCREPITACGLPVGAWLCERAEPALRFKPLVQDAEELPAGAVLAILQGNAASILRLERTLLNFMMRLCAVASLTQQFVQAVANTGAKILDTRKTIPGWRILDKYAVRIGGGHNHRFNLGSGILIKDNHIAACGSLGEAVRRARQWAPHGLKVEVEVEDFAGVQEALAAGADLLLLDNMKTEQVRQISEATAGKALLEVSGGITLKTVRAYAEAGANYISVGELTHSAPAVDLSMEF